MHKVGVLQPARAAGALGDVLAGQLEVHSAEVRARRGMDLKRLLEFGEDVLETARLNARARHFRVAVHRIAGPEECPARPPDRINHRWQEVVDLSGSETMDDREAARLRLRIQHFDEPRELARGR